MEGLRIAIDVILVLFIVIFTIVAVKRGFVKTVIGFISSILVLVIAIMAAAPLANAIGKGTSFDEKTASFLEEKYASKIPNAYNEITYYDLNGDGEKELAVKNSQNEYKEYSETFEDSFWKYLNIEKIMQKTVEANIDKDDGSSITVISAFSKTVTIWIMLVVCFIGLLIGSKIAFWIIIKLLKNLIEKVSFVATLDRILGGVVGFVAAILIVLTVLALIQFMSSFPFMTRINEVLANTKITSLIMKNNFIYILFENGITFEKMKDLFGGLIKR